MSYFHICVRGNDHQAMFYNEWDYIRAINNLALAADKNQTKVLAYSFISNHWHLIISLEGRPNKFVQSFRVRNTKQFNYSHDTIGSSGENGYCCLQIKDPEQLIEKAVYVLRNSVKHQNYLHPYSDYWNSAGLYFQKSQINMQNVLTSKSMIRKYLPFHTSLPPTFLMNEKGMILPQTFVDTEPIETVFGNKDNFLRMLSTPTKTEEEESEKHKNYKAIVTDIELINELNKICPDGVFKLDIKGKVDVARKLKETCSCSIKQLSRLIHMPYSTLSKRLKYR